MRFWRTVSHGKMEPCCEIRMPFGLGSFRSTPSVKTLPRSGRTNPATMFINVVLPHPDGPTITTVSPSPTEKLTPSTTPSVPPLVGNAFARSRTSILLRIPPADRLEAFEEPHDAVEQQPDQADDDHARDDEVVAVSGVPRVDDEIAESGAERDHLRRDDDEPCDTQADPHADDDVRQDRGDDHAAEQRGAGDAEVPGGLQVATLDRVHAGRRLDDHRKHGRDEDQEDRGRVPDA